MILVLQNLKKVFLPILFILMCLGFANGQTQMAPACDVPMSAKGSITGLNVSFGTAVNNPSNSIDGNLNTASVFNFGFGAGFVVTWHDNVALSGLYAGDAFVSLTLSSSAVSANIIGGINLVAYNGTAEVWRVNLGGSLASWFLNIGGLQSGIVKADNNNPYDHLEIQYSNLANLGFYGEVLRVSEIRRVPYKPETSIAESSPNICTGTATLTASTSNIISNDISYAWYQGSTPSGSPIGTSATYNNAMAGQTYTVVSTVDGSCPFVNSARKDTETFNVPAITQPTVNFEEACVNKTASLTATVSGATITGYQWSTTDGNILGGANTNSIEYSNNGTYTLTATTNTGCTITKNYSVTNYNPATCGTGLPIILDGNFTATRNKNAVDLTWKTRTEINNKEFEIWKSTDGKTFDQLITSAPSQAANGNSTAPLSYIRTDNDPVNGVNYYQLKQTDLDGKTVIVQTTSITLSGITSDLSVFPSPATTELNVKGISVGDSYRIINISGKEVVPATTFNGSKISLKNIVSGVYILQVSSKSGATKTIKFVKQ